MTVKRYWTPDQDRAWRRTFTPANIEAERRFVKEAREIGVEAIARRAKAQSQEKGDKQKRQRADDMARMFKDGKRADAQVSLAEGVPHTRAGVKSLVIYTSTEKITESYDGLGNLTSVEAVPLSSL